MNNENLKERAGKGRPKGSENKTTIAVKEAFQFVFDDIGGNEGFSKWAKKPKNTGLFYAHYAKLLPLSMNHSGEIKLPALVELPPKKPKE